MYCNLRQGIFTSLFSYVNSHPLHETTQNVLYTFLKMFLAVNLCPNFIFRYAKQTLTEAKKANSMFYLRLISYIFRLKQDN